VEMDQERFCSLPLADLSQLVRSQGPRVLTLPVNGTRRWFMLEHPGDNARDLQSRFEQYRDTTVAKYVDLFQMIFDHGIHTLLSPEFGSELLTRGETYARIISHGLAGLATHPVFLGFYDSYQVRVRFYGDYRQVLRNSPYAYLVGLFDDLTERTKSYDHHRLFYGICANDATEAVAGLAVHYHAQHGQVPDRRTIVSLYYGEPVEPVDLFIGFDKFSAFDMPLLALGEEDLYFTVTPSLYMTQRQLREILHDHMYTRKREGTENWQVMEAFYRKNAGRTLGLGRQRDGFWYPVPQVELPPGY
jgi:tuberculosinol/isotuberculosinol synthase